MTDNDLHLKLKKQWNYSVQCTAVTYEVYLIQYNNLYCTKYSPGKDFFKTVSDTQTSFSNCQQSCKKYFLRKESFDNPSASDSSLPNIYFVVLPCVVYVLNCTNLHVLEKG